MTGDVLGVETQHLLTRTRSQCILKPFDIHQARAAIYRVFGEVSAEESNNSNHMVAAVMAGNALAATTQ